MRNNRYHIQHDQFDAILGEFSLSIADVPKLIVDALYCDKPQVSNAAFSATINNNLEITLGSTRRFPRLEYILVNMFNEWAQTDK
jgi:hypothetical protein